jgi:hypothetical protein
VTTGTLEAVDKGQNEGTVRSVRSKRFFLVQNKTHEIKTTREDCSVALEALGRH